MIKVLIVDDSAVMRSFLSSVVKAQPDMEVVATASDPVLAMDRIRQFSPDVITLDVEMPRMNGLDFLRQLMAVRPLPVLMISSLTMAGANTTIRALELGAVDFFAKPTELSELDVSAAEIAEKIRGAASARVARHGMRTPAATTAQMPLLPRVGHKPGPVAQDRLIAIGASTGGVEALREILMNLPQAVPPILIAQHMPPGFTDTFAKRLDTLCKISVKQADDGESAHNGIAYIAPGGRHLTVVRRALGYVLRVTNEPPVNRHKPSVDPLFRSVASVCGKRAIGLMLTGMGADGAEAMLALYQTGAHTLAQDEASCVVFGMPRQAIALGAVREVLPLNQMASRLAELSNR